MREAVVRAEEHPQPVQPAEVVRQVGELVAREVEHLQRVRQREDLARKLGEPAREVQPPGAGQLARAQPGQRVVHANDAEAVDAVLALAALQQSFEPQQVQVRHRLAHGEGHLVQVELALEQDRQALGRAVRLAGAGLQQLGQAVAVVFLQLLDAPVDAGEGLAVRRQAQRVGRQRLEALDAVEEEAQRIRLRLARVHAHVGRDARQHHVAAQAAR